MYELRFDDDKPIDFLAKLPKALGRRIYKKIISAKSNPFHFFERLKGRTDYKLRVGDYRVIADIDKNEKLIEVTLIEHRRKVYK